MARLCLLTAAAIAALTGTAVAADISNTLDGPLRGSFTTEFGTRVWIGSGSTSKNLLSPGGRFLNSRLTYGGLGSGSAELFGKVSADDFFLSGYAGLGTTPGGSLQDEDFPPSVAPYSSTRSPLQNGSLSYLTVDVGHNFYDAAGTRLGAFVGYNYLNQQLNAFGCTQDAANPGICVPAIGSATAVISQTNTWQSLRFGLSGDMQLHGPWTLSGEGAVLPYVSLHGSDTHWLRIPADFTGPIPEDGTGWGVQLQAMLDYHLNDHLSLGIGGRYWQMQATGSAHFEDHLAGGGGVAQPLTWNTGMAGLLTEAKATF